MSSCEFSIALVDVWRDEEEEGAEEHGRGFSGTLRTGLPPQKLLMSFSSGLHTRFTYLVTARLRTIESRGLIVWEASQGLLERAAPSASCLQLGQILFKFGALGRCQKRQSKPDLFK